MKIIAISDTHGQHDQVTLPQGDIIIHAGDVSNSGKKSEVLEFLEWFGNLDYAYKIFIAGNHDFYFEEGETSEINNIIPKNVIYLNDSGVSINGISIWGSPVQPRFFDWAFNRDRGAAINAHWKLIPDHTDILITHGPAMGILDQTKRGDHVGCADLLNNLERVLPKYFIFGHIHEAYGQAEHLGIQCLNASVLDLKYRLRNKPLVFDLP